MSLIKNTLPDLLCEGKTAELCNLKALHPSKEQWIADDESDFALTYCFRATSPYHVMTPTQDGSHLGFAATKFSVSVMAVPGKAGPKPPALDERGDPVLEGCEPSTTTSAEGGAEKGENAKQDAAAAPRAGEKEACQQVGEKRERLEEPNTPREGAAGLPA